MKLFFHGVFALCRKELRMILKDPRSRLVLVMPIILQSLLFGYAVSFDLNDVPFAVLDEDNSSLSRDLARRFDASPVFQRAAAPPSATAIPGLLDNGEVLLVIHIAAGTGRRAEAGLPAPVQILADGRNALTGATAMGYAVGIVEAFAAERAPAPQTLRVISRALYNPNLETRFSILPGLIASLAMLQTVLHASLATAREKEQGTYDQLRITPLSPFALMLGKTLPPMLVGYAQSVLIFLVARFWFQIPCAGSTAAIAVVLLPMNLALAGLGLSISILSRNMQQAMLLCFAAIMPMMLLSGLMTPIRAMPEFMQYATMANPMRFAVDAIRRIYLEGAPLRLLSFDLVGLACLALPATCVSALLFRKRG